MSQAVSFAHMDCSQPVPESQPHDVWAAIPDYEDIDELYSGGLSPLMDPGPTAPKKGCDFLYWA
jgi:hypothetical protein